jgi:L-fuculose-phosphate aldolase
MNRSIPVRPESLVEMADEFEFRSKREAIVETGLAMVEGDLTTGTGGNVSARTGDSVVISPSAVPYDEIDPADVPVVTLDGERVAGDLPPSSETPMHTNVYAGREDIGGIVHTHSPYASTFASLDEPIPASSYLIAYAGHEVPVAGYAPPGSEELAEYALDALDEETNACLLRNHGVLAVGETVEAAHETALIVEHCARIHYQASAIGDPVILSDQEVDELIAGFEEYRNQ